MKIPLRTGQEISTFRGEEKLREFFTRRQIYPKEIARGYSLNKNATIKEGNLEHWEEENNAIGFLLTLEICKLCFVLHRNYKIISYSLKCRENSQGIYIQLEI